MKTAYEILAASAAAVGIVAEDILAGLALAFAVAAGLREMNESRNRS